MSMPEGAAAARGSKVTSFVRGALVAVALLCFVHVLFAFKLHQSTAVKAVPAVVGLLLLGSLALKAERRAEIALVVLPIVVVLHGFAIYLASARPPPASAAAQGGRSFDTRSKAEVIADLRSDGTVAYPSVMPKLLGAHLVHKGETLDSGEGGLFPLGGISTVTTVYCNEGGDWLVYDADEHGFNNPKGIWTSPSIEVGIVGDSYTHGACVPPDKNFPARIREKHPTTLNLGMGGNGPLQELAGVREYLSVVKPKNVIWAYFRNDLDDLDYFKSSALLRKYVDDPTFRQGVFDAQPKIDTSLKTLVDKMYVEAVQWPKALGSRGITRKNMPFWLQDLVMGEYATGAAQVIRLDFLRGGKPLQKPTENPDFPLFEQVMARAKSDVASWGGKLYFLFLPDRTGNGSTAHDRFRDPVTEIIKKLGLPIIDAQPAFDAQAVGALTYSAASHCNPAGYEVIGRLVNEALEAAH